jgi:hypothetical protein
MSAHRISVRRRSLLGLAVSLAVTPAPVRADPYRNESGKPRSDEERRRAIDERRRERRLAREEYVREAGKLSDERARELDKIDEEYWREVWRAEREYDRELAEGKDSDDAFGKYAERIHGPDDKFGGKVEEIDEKYHDAVWRRR